MLDRLYGYEIADGKYRVQKTEAKTIRAVMEKAASGHSYTGLAAGLNADQIKTRKKDGKWTHTMISNMIKNRRYSGELGYPKIVSRELQERAVSILKEKQTENATKKSISNNKKSPFFKKIRCSQCGSNVFLYDDGEERYWRCVKETGKYGKSICGIYEYHDGVRDSDIRKAVSELFDEIATGKTEIVPQGEKRPDHLGIVKIENRMKELLESENVDFEQVDRLLRKKNEIRYEQYRYETSSETMMMKKRLSELSPDGEPDRDMIDQFIKSMILYPEGVLRIILLNDQTADKEVTILRRGKKNGKNSKERHRSAGRSAEG